MLSSKAPFIHTSYHLKHHIMILSGCISITKPVIIFASLSSDTPQPNTPRRLSKIASPKKSYTKQKQPSIAEVERAIGAGIYRDHDPASDTGENKGLFDVVLSSTIGKREGSTERKLRETGEWISVKTETAARSSGKKILEIMFFWIAPAWLLLLLIATGGIKLPSSLSALNDLIM